MQNYLPKLGAQVILLVSERRKYNAIVKSISVMCLIIFAFIIFCSYLIKPSWSFSPSSAPFSENFKQLIFGEYRGFSMCVHGLNIRAGWLFQGVEQPGIYF